MNFFYSCYNKKIPTDISPPEAKIKMVANFAKIGYHFFNSSGSSLFGIQPFDHIHASVIIRSGHLPVSAPAVPAFHPAAGLDGERRLV